MTLSVEKEEEIGASYALKLDKPVFPLMDSMISAQQATPSDIADINAEVKSRA